jgi:DNA-binding NtrC family response regulator
MIRILVDGPDPDTGSFLRSRLAADRFEVVEIEPGASFVDVVRRARPLIAVIDRVHEGQEVARMKIAVLKDICPGVRIVAVSQLPSARDARIIEEGVFYYMTVPVGEELIRIIEAGANSLRPSSDGADYEERPRTTNR